MLNTRALLLATLVGTVLQVVMVLAGHTNRTIAGWFAVGGMGFSFLAGLAYAMWARGSGMSSLVVGGLIAGAVCAFIGILVSHLLGDVPASLLALGTISSAVTGALGGALGRVLFPALLVVPFFVASAQSTVQAQWSEAPGAQDTGAIAVDAVVNAPVSAVWNAWGTSEGLRRWLAPHAEIDLRIGGTMRTNYNREGSLGDPSTIENRILSFDPERMLTLQVSRAPAGLPFANAIAEMWTVIYFEPVGESMTRVSVIGLGFTSHAESQQMRAFFERGNAATLQQLQRYFAGKASP